MANIREILGATIGVTRREDPQAIIQHRLADALNYFDLVFQSSGVKRVGRIVPNKPLNELVKVVPEDSISEFQTQRANEIYHPQVPREQLAEISARASQVRHAVTFPDERVIYVKDSYVLSVPTTYFLVELLAHEIGHIIGGETNQNVELSTIPNIPKIFSWQQFEKSVRREVLPRYGIASDVPLSCRRNGFIHFACGNEGVIAAAAGTVYLEEIRADIYAQYLLAHCDRIKQNISLAQALSRAENYCREVGDEYSLALLNYIRHIGINRLIKPVVRANLGEFIQLGNKSFRPKGRNIEYLNELMTFQEKREDLSY